MTYGLTRDDVEDMAIKELEAMIKAQAGRDTQSFCFHRGRLSMLKTLGWNIAIDPDDLEKLQKEYMDNIRGIE